MYEQIKKLVIKCIQRKWMHDGHLPPFPVNGEMGALRQVRIELLTILSTMCYVLQRKFIIYSIRDYCTEMGMRMHYNIPVPGMPNSCDSLVLTSDGWYIWTNTNWDEADYLEIVQNNEHYTPFRQDNHNPMVQ